MWLFLVLTVLYLGLAGRFAWVQVVDYSQKLELRDLRQFKDPARRGNIYDRNGVPLAITEDGYDVWVRPRLARHLNEGPEIVQAAARILNMSGLEISQRLNEDVSFAFLKRRVGHNAGAAIRALHLQSLGADHVFLRDYPQGELAAQVIGRVNTDDVGNAGIEAGMNQVLSGQDGVRQYRVDGRQAPIPGTEAVLQKIRNGNDLRLTLDARIQNVAEQQLNNAIQAHHAAAGCTVVLDVRTGEILAMASRPTFSPGAPVTNMGALLNRGISYAYEPGSTMKMVTASAALTEKAWSLSDTVTCKGSMVVGKHVIHCVVDPPYHGGHGVETLRDIIRNSCNIGAATIGLKLGGTDLYRYIERFGLLDRPNLGLPGAVAYRLSPPDDWARIRLANVAFGQGIMVTPLQMLAAYGAVANHGLLMQSHIISSVANPDTGAQQIEPITPVRQVVPEAVARSVVDLLMAVVYDGTGKNAQIPGYEVAGKTGSAQKAGAHGYLQGRFIASFVGFAPASNPRVACITMIDEPQGLHWGAVCAAPVVREVLRWSLHYLQAPPDDPALTADGAYFASVLKQEHLGVPLPGSPGWDRGRMQGVSRPSLGNSDESLHRLGDKGVSRPGHDNPIV
jgi:stage V sporulation protein D (sporulation-specific penicillin-binding protein)